VSICSVGLVATVSITYKNGSVGVVTSAWVHIGPIYTHVTETVTIRPREHDTVQGAVSHLFDLHFGRFEQAQ